MFFDKTVKVIWGASEMLIVVATIPQHLHHQCGRQNNDHPKMSTSQFLTPVSVFPYMIGGTLQMGRC